MATTTDPVAGVQMIALSEIRHDQNVRQELLADQVDALAQSIALLGQLTPGERPAGHRERRVCDVSPVGDYPQWLDLEPLFLVLCAVRGCGTSDNRSNRRRHLAPVTGLGGP
jgi:hypothetical protein